MVKMQKSMNRKNQGRSLITVTYRLLLRVFTRLSRKKERKR